MKKFLPTLLLFTLLPAIALATPGPTLAANDFSCAWNSSIPACRVQSQSCDPGNSVDPNKCDQFKSPAACTGTFTCVVGSVVPLQTNGPWYDQSPSQFHQKVFGSPDNEIFGERYTYAQINWIFNSLINMVMPKITTLDELRDYIQNIRTSNNAQPTLADYAQLGIPGLLVGGISETLSHPPASGIQSFAEMGSRLQIVPSAYAQAPGYGFDTLLIVRKLWTATRNMAYLIAVIFLIAAGFAIMFRIKINPQTVVSLQTMIPKLIISLLLITFSYAIAGLVLDLIYVIIAIFLGFLSTFGVIDAKLPDAIAFFTSSSYGNVVGYFIWPWLAIFALGVFLPTWFSVVPNAILLLIGLLGMIFLGWTLFKIWWMLVKTQITLIFLIILGPFQIMLDLIPGQSGFTSWFRNIIANASVFAVVPIMFILNMLFWRPLAGLMNIKLPDWISSFFNPLGKVEIGTGASTWLPNLPFVNGSGFIFNLVAGYVILAMIPKVADMIRDALKVPAFKYGAAFGEALGPVKFAPRLGLEYSGGQISEAFKNEPGVWGAAGRTAGGMLQTWAKKV